MQVIAMVIPMVAQLPFHWAPGLQLDARVAELQNAQRLDDLLVFGLRRPKMKRGPMAPAMILSNVGIAMS